MVSDQEILTSLESLLRQSPPGAAAAASLAGVVRHLEATLGTDLSHKAAFIRDHIALLLSPPPKDHHFALYPQFYHPSAPPPPQFHQIPASASTASPFTHLPQHHEFAFRYPAQMPGPVVHQQQEQILHRHAEHSHQQQQQQLKQAVPVVRPAAPASAAPPAKESASTGVKRRGGPGGLSKVCGVTPELQAIVGEPTMARTEIVKQLWAYIRKNNLQDPNNKRKIICNDELRLVFETDCTDMFKMNKLLSKHIITLEPTKDAGSNSKKLKVTAEVVSATESDPGQMIVAISDALVNFLGTGEREMLQSEALSRVWDYIKANQLEDPMNPMVVLCDSKLQQLFGCESLSALGIQEMLMRHLFKQS